MKKKKLTFAVSTALVTAMLLLATFSCTKEEVSENYISITLATHPDSLFVGSPVVFNIERNSDHASIYVGEAGKAFGDGSGEMLLPEAESYSYTYLKYGTFTVTVIAKSYGNWSEQEKVDIDSITINVEDIRSQMDFFNLRRPEHKGVVRDDSIIFNVSMLEYAEVLDDTRDLERARILFGPVSPEAQVLIGSEEQQTNTNFDLAANPTITVVSPEGSSQDYKVYFIVADPRTDKDLSTISTIAPDVEGVLNEDDLSISFALPWGCSPENIKLAGTSSDGSIISYDGTEIPDDGALVNLELLEDVIVMAEDSSTQSYSIQFTVDSVFTSFSFSDSTFTYQPIITIDHDTRTITAKILPGHDITSLTAAFTLTDMKIVARCTFDIYLYISLNALCVCTHMYTNF